MFLFFPQSWLIFGLRIVFFIRNPSHFLLWIHCFTVFSLPALPLWSPLTFCLPFLFGDLLFEGYYCLFIFTHTHTLWRLSILIFCDNVPWWKALFLFTTLALDMYVGTEYSYSLVLGNCLIFSTIFFFLSFMEILLGQLMDLLHCSSNFLIFSLLFSIFLSFAVVILFPNKFFQLFQFCLSFLLNFYFCDCIFNF